ncbi:MAG: hypothetical protein WCI89_00820 [bacterium]
MQKELSHTNARTIVRGISRGISLIEVVISAALILLLATLFVSALLSGEQGAQTSGARARAGFLAEEGLEAARNMRDQSFANLVDGTYGIGTSNGSWTFVGTSDTKDTFTRAVSIKTVNATTKGATSTVTWTETGGRTGSVSLYTYFTNLGLLPPIQANRLTVNTAGAVVGGSTFKELNGITLQNTGASSITISKLNVVWTPVGSAKLTGTTINGVVVWSSTGPGSPAGQQSSGATTTLSAVTITSGTTLPLTRLLFTTSMHNTAFTLSFTMSDNSVKTVTIPTLP